MALFQGEIGYWLAFLAFVAVLLALDLGVLNREAHVISIREAVWASVVWVGLALMFGLVVLRIFGSTRATEYYTAWLLEKSLSVDNLFVFVLIFGFFHVPAEYHHRILFWGIIGAIVMRAILILVGATLIVQFNWLLLIFGAFLIYTGLRLFRVDDDGSPDIAQNPLLRLGRRFLRITDEYHGKRFFVRQNGLLFATPMMLVLLVVESTDLVFAVDSIPAVIGISRDPFIVFSSNVMATLGLRSLYFLLAGAVDRFHYLQPALGVILTFVGVKMIAEHFIQPPQGFEAIFTYGPLVFILVVLAIAIGASIVRERRLRIHGRGRQTPVSN